MKTRKKSTDRTGVVYLRILLSDCQLAAFPPAAVILVASLYSFLLYPTILLLISVRALRPSLNTSLFLYR